MAKLGSKDFDIHEYMGEATVEILLGEYEEYNMSDCRGVQSTQKFPSMLTETAMGVDKGTQDREAGEYVTSVMKYVNSCPQFCFAFLSERER